MSNTIQRRAFLISAGFATAPAILSPAGPNDQIGVAMIGVGNRGFYLLREFQNIAGVEIRVVCDLYDGNLQRAKEFSKNTEAQYTKKWEEAIAAPGIDAVVIATPDFWHAPMALAAAKAKKDIYLEKPLCMTVAEAKQLRAAVKENKVVLQLGHHRNSTAPLHKAQEFFRSGRVGTVPLVRTYCDRGYSRPPWKFYGDALVSEMPKDASPQTIDWERFVANAPKHPFDAERFFRWRGWWDYSTGVAGDLMSHLWDSVNMIMAMGIPETCMTHGALYFWKNELNVPDMWHVVFDYPKRELVVTFNQCFHNGQYGDVTQFLGRDGTIEAGPSFCRVYGTPWKRDDDPKKLMEMRRRMMEARQKTRAAGGTGAAGPAGAKGPVYTFKAGELEVSTHWQNFIDCTRTRERPRCDIDRGFEEAVTVAMSIEAYHQKRTVRWDPAKEEVV